MNKPDVLTDEEITEWIIDNRGASEEAVKKLLPPLEWSLEAQRDDTWQKAQDYYEPLIKDAKFRGYELALEKLDIEFGKGYAQAKQDTAREIFGEIEDNYYGMGEMGGKPFEGVLIMPDEYQSLKSKFIEEEK